MRVMERSEHLIELQLRIQSAGIRERFLTQKYLIQLQNLLFQAVRSRAAQIATV